MGSRAIAAHWDRSVQLNLGVHSRIASPAGALTVGRDERYWDAPLDGLPWWDGNIQGDEAIVLAPHPDDEVLACAGLLQRAARRQRRLELWLITDGEGCCGANLDPQTVAHIRREEARKAYRRLGLGDDRVALRSFGLPDGHVAQHAEAFLSQLRARLKSETTLIAPLAMDGHSDNDAIGAMARKIAREKQLFLVAYPVWLWHWAEADTLRHLAGACRLGLTAAEELKKREAIAAFHSQIYSTWRDEAVLPRRVLRHFRRPFEVFFIEDHRVAASRA